MRIAVWEFDDARWSAIEAACLACKTKAERFTECVAGIGFAQTRYDVAIVALHDPSANSDPALIVATYLQSVGIGVIAHGTSVATWPISTKCRALLAGARHLLDNDADDFPQALLTTLNGVLQSLRDERTDEDRVRTLARDNGIVGQSAGLLSAFRQVVRLSKLSDLPVLITGESGTGKELFASALHALDPKRCEHEMVAVNCAAINSGVAESELFGHQRGAFTGAARDHGGLFQSAQGGVLFLDEIGELSLDLQAKILRVLQEKRVRKLGAGDDAAIDVRVIAATNQDLPQMIRDGRFRNDLFHRLNSLSIHVDPLRERSEDVALLIDHFLDMHGSWKKVRGVDPDFIDAVSHLQLPGNVRELKNVVTTALAGKCDDLPLGLKDLPVHIWREMLQSRCAGAQPSAESIPSRDDEEDQMADMEVPSLPTGDAGHWNLDEYMIRCERKLVVAAMERVKNNQSQAARLLGLTPRSIYNKLRKHQLLDKPAI